MTGHSEKHAAWMAEALTSDLAPSRTAEIEACPECGARFARLRRIATSLRAEGVAEREDRARARDPIAGELEAAASARLREVSAASATASRRARSVLPWAAVAALLVVALALAWWLRRDPGPRRDILLTTSRIEVLSPGPVTSSYDLFEWNGKLESGGWFEFTARTLPGESAAGSTLPLVRRTQSTHILFSNEDTADWPPAIEWNVQRMDATGVPQASSGWRAVRRSP